MSFCTRYFSMSLVSFLSSFGGIGDCLFFGLTAWFLCEEEPLFKKSVRRAWMLEKQLLFYAVILFVFQVTIWKCFGYGDMSPKHVLRMILSTAFPFASSHWWYPTSYILFLLLFPWFTIGLRALGKMRHGILAISLLVLHGVLPWSIFRLDMAYSVVLFLYLYILLSFLKWYMPSILTDSRLAVKLIVCALGFDIVSVLLIQLIRPDAQNRVWMNCPSNLPSLVISLGLLVLANTRRKLTSKLVNKLASCTLAVYLILVHDGVNGALTELVTYLFPVHGFAFIGICSVAAIVFYLCCLGVDCIRQLVFSLTVDRHNGRLFEVIWGRIARSNLIKSVTSQLKASDNAD